jgi:hypothetical protein
MRHSLALASADRRCYRFCYHNGLFMMDLGGINASDTVSSLIYYLGLI